MLWHHDSIVSNYRNSTASHHYYYYYDCASRNAGGRLHGWRGGKNGERQLCGVTVSPRTDVLCCYSVYTHSCQRRRNDHWLTEPQNDTAQSESEYRKRIVRQSASEWYVVRRRDILRRSQLRAGQNRSVTSATGPCVQLVDNVSPTCMQLIFSIITFWRRVDMPSDPTSSRHRMQSDFPLTIVCFAWTTATPYLR